MAGAVAVMAVATIGSSMYSAQQQRKATRDASDAQRNAEMEARRIAAGQKPMEEKATLGMDTGGETSALGSLGLMIEPDKQKRLKMGGLGTAGTTGLSSTSTSGLGFGS